MLAPGTKRASLAGLARDGASSGPAGGGDVVDAGRTTIVTARVVPPNAAETVALFVSVTETVLRVNVALLAPGATVTLPGIDTMPGLLLDKATTAPPLDAALVNVTVPCDVVPPTKLVGFSVSDESVS